MPALPQRAPVTEVPAADRSTAQAHFERLLQVETDCWDVHAELGSVPAGFVLVDVRSPELFGQGHIAGAVNIPHGRLNARALAAYPADALFVVYCGGSHCNGADKAALRLARLGRPVKKMIGGILGWKDEGFELTTGIC